MFKKKIYLWKIKASALLDIPVIKFLFNFVFNLDYVNY